MTWARLLLPIAIVVTSAACVETIAESRVRGSLVDAGLSAANADCMAKRMVDRLSIAQLRKLQKLRGEKRSLGDYVSAVRRVGDAEALAVTASSAALCGTGLAR